MGEIDNISASPVECVLGGKARHFLFTFSSILHLAKKYGSMAAMVAKLSNPENLKTMEASSVEALVDFVYAALIHEDKKITPEMVADMLTVQNLAGVVQAAMAAYGASLPTPDPTLPRPTTPGTK